MGITFVTFAAINQMLQIALGKDSKNFQILTFNHPKLCDEIFQCSPAKICVEKTHNDSQTRLQNHAACLNAWFPCGFDVTGWIAKNIPGAKRVR